MIVGEAVGLVGIGVGLGLPVAGMCGRLAGSLLYEVAPTDPATLTGAGAALVLLGGLAAAIPAYRAVTIEPAEALRSE